MMDISIVEEKVEKLYNRKYLVFKVIFDGPTPSRDEIKKELSQKFNLNADLMVIEKIETVFGESIALVYVYVYDDENAFKLLAKSHLLKRDSKPKEEE